ncbi:hypothetical protein AB0L82_42210 [Nocardia sp. NPDC052001]|uniref:hypothetical protein n=1 Tax=Nocardia sp. NPDC052001 TaxID=3154853 RepID=UPI00341C97DB
MTVTYQTSAGRTVISMLDRSSNGTPQRDRLVRAQAGLATLAGGSALSALAILTLLSPHL